MTCSELCVFWKYGVHHRKKRVGVARFKLLKVGCWRLQCYGMWCFIIWWVVTSNSRMVVLDYLTLKMKALWSQNVGNCLPSAIVSHPRGLEPPAALLSEPQIEKFFFSYVGLQRLCSGVWLVNGEDCGRNRSWCVVFFLLGDTLAYEFYMLTLQNTVPSS
jgi:hypothetical protein